MNSGMAENRVRVVLDTNILVSAIAFGGKPAQILLLSIEERIQAITSAILLAELEEILNKKLVLPKEELQLALEEIRDSFEIVQPQSTIEIVRDEDDNRVLEAAAEGSCNYIITGDKDLLDLGNYQDIEIMTAEQFLSQELKSLKDLR